MSITSIKNFSELKKILQNCNILNIYGAGAVSEDIITFLINNNLKPKRIIVTNKTSEFKNNIPIISLKDAIQFKNELVIVAVSELYKEEIIKSLSEHHFKNILTVGSACFHSLKMMNEKAISFQIHLVEHCNLKCSGCYHFSSLAKEEYLSEEEFDKDLKRISYLFNGKAKEIMLLGGEPLLHPRVADFFYIARKYFPIGKIKILSNGLLLCNMKKDFFYAIKENNAELWITKYPVNYDYNKAEQYAKDFDVTLNYFNKEPVRSLGHQPLDLSGKQNYEKNFNSCYRANQCIDLKHGKLYPCIIPAEIKPFCEYFSINLPVCKDDYIDIYNVKNKEEIIEKLSEPIPFCRYCNRENIKIFGAKPWNITNFSLNEWID